MCYRYIQWKTSNYTPMQYFKLHNDKEKKNQKKREIKCLSPVDFVVLLLGGLNLWKKNVFKVKTTTLISGNWKLHITNVVVAVVIIIVNFLLFLIIVIHSCLQFVCAYMCCIGVTRSKRLDRFLGIINNMCHRIIWYKSVVCVWMCVGVGKHFEKF